jgi:type III pantothenate kinase
MGLNLTLDIGNSFTKWGLFKGEILLTKGIFASHLDTPEYWMHQKIENVVYCASGRINDHLLKFIHSYPSYVNIQQLPLPFESVYQTPQTLGRDRVAAVLAAISIFNNKDLLIIDAGTCVTYDFYSKVGVHMGGTISPGLRMRWNALNTFTEKLPLIQEGSEIKSPLAKNTHDAIQQGGLLGLLYEMEGYISYFKHHYPKVKILITGGDALLFVKFIKIKIFAEPNLVLKGLNEILKNYAAKNG